MLLEKQYHDFVEEALNMQYNLVWKIYIGPYLLVQEYCGKATFTHIDDTVK